MKNKNKKHYLTAKRRWEIKKKKAIVVIITLSIGILGIAYQYIQLITPLQMEIIQNAEAKTTKKEEEKELTIKEHVWQLLIEEGGLTFDEAIEAMAIVKCESGWNEYAIGVNKDGSKDLGLWQWNEKWNPHINRQCAFDVYCSTREAIKAYKKNGNWGIWVCSSKI